MHKQRGNDREATPPSENQVRFGIIWMPQQKPCGIP